MRENVRIFLAGAIAAVMLAALACFVHADEAKPPPSTTDLQKQIADLKSEVDCLKQSVDALTKQCAACQQACPNGVCVNCQNGQQCGLPGCVCDANGLVEFMPGHKCKPEDVAFFRAYYAGGRQGGSCASCGAGRRRR